MKTARARVAVVVLSSLALVGCTSQTPPVTASADVSASPSPAAPDNRAPQEQLVDAIQTSDIDLATVALEAGADPNNVDDATGNSPVSLAITRDDAAMVTLLLEAGGEVEFEGTGFTMLGLAAQFAGASVAQAILDVGADPNGRSQTDASGLEVSYGGPLFAAASQGNVEVMEVLLQAGARTDVVLPFGPYRMQPLGAAAYGGSTEAVDLLLMWGADPAWAGPDGLTAADMATARNHADLYAYLRELEG